MNLLLGNVQLELSKYGLQSYLSKVNRYSKGHMLSRQHSNNLNGHNWRLKSTLLNHLFMTFSLTTCSKTLSRDTLVEANVLLISTIYYRIII